MSLFFVTFFLKVFFGHFFLKMEVEDIDGHRITRFNGVELHRAIIFDNVCCPGFIINGRFTRTFCENPPDPVYCDDCTKLWVPECYGCGMTCLPDRKYCDSCKDKSKCKYCGSTKLFKIKHVKNVFTSTCVIFVTKRK